MRRARPCSSTGERSDGCPSYAAKSFPWGSARCRPAPFTPWPVRMRTRPHRPFPRRQSGFAGSSSPTANPFTSTESGTAEKNKDYRALDHRIGFRAEDFALGPWRVDGQEVQRWKALRRVPVELLADDEVEGDEVFFIVLEADNATPENVTFPTRPIREIIWDDDLEIDVAIQDPPSQIAENAGRTHITLAASVRRPYARGVSSGVKLTEERRSRSRTVRARAGNGDARCRCVGAVWSFRDTETASDAPYRVFNMGIIYVSNRNGRTPERARP